MSTTTQQAADRPISKCPTRPWFRQVGSRVTSEVGPFSSLVAGPEGFEKEEARASLSLPRLIAPQYASHHPQTCWGLFLDSPPATLRLASPYPRSSLMDQYASYTAAKRLRMSYTTSRPFITPSALAFGGELFSSEFFVFFFFSTSAPPSYLKLEWRGLTGEPTAA